MKPRIHKSELLAGASAAALCLGLAFPAQAFNQVNWTWDAHINEEITKTVTITIELEPTGLVMLEDLQVLIGDVTATSYVSNIYNYQPTDEENGGTTTVSVPVDLGQFTATGSFPAGGGAFQIAGSHSGGDVSLTPLIDSSASNGGSLLGASFTTTWNLGTIFVDFEIPGGGGALDALTELPEVVSSATAVGNNTSISSDTAVQLHEGQFVFGDGDVDSIGDVLAVGAAALLGVALANDGVNSNLVGAGVLGTLAILGALEKSQISATSNVNAILNATVDSSATAVANNLTVDIEANGPDRLFIGDVVQFAYADVSASSTVSNVSLNNYMNLGLLDRPIVSSVATAVGNNKSISVGSIAP